IVLQTKILVDLKQSLLLRDGFREAGTPRVGAKEPGGSGFQPAVGQARPKLFVVRPDVATFREETGKKNVGEDVRDPRLADDRHFAALRLGLQRVVKVPKRMAQIQEKILRGHGIFSGDRFDEGGPRAREEGEGAEAALGMIEGPRTAQPPKFAR